MSKFTGFIIGGLEIIAGAVLIATGVGGPLGVELIVSGAGMIVTQAVVDLTAPKEPARQASEMSIAVGEQPRVMLVGECETPGSLVDGFDFGGKYDTDWECLPIRLADHKCHSLTGFYVNDEYNLYAGDGLVPRYGDQLKIFFRSDTSSQPLPADVLTYGPDWTAADIGRSGCDVFVFYKADKPNEKHPVWPGGRPRFRFVVKGKLCYDPRKDSTVPGGSGPHRWEDPSTWEFSENPVVIRYNWVRGVFAEDDVTDPTKLLIGRGLSAIEAPPENIIAAANLCDEGVAGPYPYLKRPNGGVPFGGGVTAEATGATMARWSSLSAGLIEWWDLPTRSLLGTSTGVDAFTGSVVNIDLASDGTAYFFGWYTTILYGAVQAFWKVPRLGSPSRTDSAGPAFAGPTRTFDLPDGTRKVLTAVYGAIPAGQTGYLELGTPTIDTQTSMDFAQHGDGSVWGLFEPVGGSSQFTLKRMTGGALSYVVVGLVARSGPAEATFCHVPVHQHFFVVSDGKWYTINDDTSGSPGTIKASGAWPVIGVGDTLNFPRKYPARDTFWSGYSLVSLADASIVETVDPLTWVSEDSNQVLYDQASNALVTASNPASEVTWRFLGPNVRYRIAGPIYANQEFIAVEQMFAAAVAGNVITHEGSVELEPGQAKSIVASFTDDDLVPGTKASWNHGVLSEADAEWVNTVVARYVEPAQQWNDHAAPVARNTDDIIADGRPREASITLRLVRDQGQAQRVAEINRRLGRIFGRGGVTLGPRFCQIEDGDWVQWISAGFNFTLTFRVDAYSVEEKWRNTLTLRQIDASVFADDIVYGADQAQVSMTPPPPAIGAPGAVAFALTPTALVSAGASVPALVVTGASDDDQAQHVIIEQWKSDGVTDPVANPDAVPWTMVGTYGPGAAEVQLPTPVGGATYYAAVSYVVGGVTGDRRVLGPETAGDLAIAFATAAEIDAGTATDKAIGPGQLVSSASPQALIDGSAISWDLGLGYNAKVTLGGNRTLATPTNPKVGLTYVLEVLQDATGSRTLTWPAGFDWGSAGTATLSTGASKHDLVTLYCYDAATPKFRAVFNKGA